MMIIWVLKFLLIATIITSCGNRNASEKNVFIDTFHRDVPSEFYDTSQRQFYNLLVNSLQIRNLENGFDSLAVRIIIDCIDTTRVVDIGISRNKQEARLFTYTSNLDDTGKLISLNIHQKESKTPRSGWSSFSDFLFKSGIFELKDFSTFGRDYNFPMDADAVAVEIATTKNYRLYVYPALKSNVNIDGPRLLYQFLSRLEEEFGVPTDCRR